MAEGGGSKMARVVVGAVSTIGTNANSFFNSSKIAFLVAPRATNGSPAASAFLALWQNCSLADNGIELEAEGLDRFKLGAVTAMVPTGPSRGVVEI